MMKTSSAVVGGSETKYKDKWITIRVPRALVVVVEVKKVRHKRQWLPQSAKEGPSSLGTAILLTKICGRMKRRQYKDKDKDNNTNTKAKTHIRYSKVLRGGS